jgi:hypothetical protein
MVQWPYIVKVLILARSCNSGNPVSSQSRHGRPGESRIAHKLILGATARLRLRLPRFKFRYGVGSFHSRYVFLYRGMKFSIDSIYLCNQSKQLHTWISCDTPGYAILYLGMNFLDKLFSWYVIKAFSFRNTKFPTWVS